MATTSNADSKLIWMDGKMLPYQEANVHVLTHSLHYGSAAFEGMRAYPTTDGRTAIFRCAEHFDRFNDSMKSLGYATPYTTNDYTRATIELIRSNGFKDCYIRPLAYIDDSIRGLKLPDSPRPRIAIATWQWGKYMGDDGQKRGVRLMISTLRRPDIASSMTWAKLSGNYLTSVLARSEATKHGFDEALLLDPQGFIAEGSGENFFIVKKGIIYTPPTGYILPGITRDSVLRIARDAGYTIREENITRNQLYLADEAFFSGTAVEVTPIREVDHKKIGTGEPGPVTKKLFDLFFKSVKGDLPKYADWLTYV